MKTRQQALDEGCTIDDSAAGRPWAYKGPRFATTSAFPILTDLEERMLELLQGLHDERSYCFIPNDREGLYRFDEKLQETLELVKGRY